MNAVSAQTSEYELVLMLDPEAADERRDEIAAATLRRIEQGGELKHDRAWGMRKLAYEIRQRTEADYRFFRFRSESALLDALDHELKIADGVLRFRIFRVDPDSPVVEPPPPVALAAASSGRGPGPRRRGPGRPPRGEEREEQTAPAASGDGGTGEGTPAGEPAAGAGQEAGAAAEASAAEAGETPSGDEQAST